MGGAGAEPDAAAQQAQPAPYQHPSSRNPHPMPAPRWLKHPRTFTVVRAGRRHHLTSSCSSCRCSPACCTRVGQGAQWHVCEPSPAAFTVGQGPSQSLVTDSKHPAAQTSPQRSCNDIAATTSSNELQQLASGPGAHPHLDLFFFLRLPLRSGSLQVGVAGRTRTEGEPIASS